MTKLRHIHFALALALAAPLIASNAEAGERGLRNPGMSAAQRHGLRHADSGTYTSVTTHTKANGQVSTRNSTTVVDKEAGTWSRNTTAVGADGKTRSSTAEGSRTDNGYVRDASRTGVDGRTSSTHTEVTRTDTGSERNTVFTAPNGKTSSTSTSVSFTPKP